jgi:hypothetical protein
LDESSSRFRLLFEHDLCGKPLRTFPDHLGQGRQSGGQRFVAQWAAGLSLGVQICCQRGCIRGHHRDGVHETMSGECQGGQGEKPDHHYGTHPLPMDLAMERRHRWPPGLGFATA